MVGADRRRVLFVEDVSGTRELIEWSLGQQGFAVTGVETADEGLRLARYCISFMKKLLKKDLRHDLQITV